MKAETGTAAGDMRLIRQLEARAALLREHSLRATSEANSGHPTSCLSAADVVAAVFFDVMRFDPTEPGQSPLRSVRALERTRRTAALRGLGRGGRLSGASDC